MKFFQNADCLPIGIAAVDNGTANRCAVAADVFGQGLDNDVGSVLDRAEHVGVATVLSTLKAALERARLGQMLEYRRH